MSSRLIPPSERGWGRPEGPPPSGDSTARDSPVKSFQSIGAPWDESLRRMSTHKSLWAIHEAFLVYLDVVHMMRRFIKLLLRRTGYELCPIAPPQSLRDENPDITDP